MNLHSPDPVYDQVMIRCADRTAAIALTLPPRPTSGDILRALNLAFIGGAECALSAAERLRMPPELAQIRLSSSRRR
ncbi:MAG: hypothetical protein KGL39_15505 [Patescibacteria group bacterium]|nr:hypothetical protein [Patescibacteria group bacterium]